MIQKSFLFALVLFGGYSLFVQFLAPSDWHASQHQSQENTIKAEHYLYVDEHSADRIIVGSSQALRLVMDGLPGYDNLSFGGQSIYDGLNILTHQTRLPKTVYIETNVVLREESFEFTESLHSPVMYFPRKWLLSLRADRQPLGILGSRLSQPLNILGLRLNRNVAKAIKWLTHKSKSAPAIATNESGGDIFSRSMQVQTESYSRKPSAKLLEARFHSLEAYVKMLRSRGVSIVFFEMPVNGGLIHLPAAEAVREAFRQHFPETAYHYIPPPAEDDYHTTDGIHLGPEEAIRYTLYFRSMTDSLTPQHPSKF